MSEGLMTVEEVAKYLKVAERTIYDWASKEHIPCAKVGGSWRFRAEDIDNWIEEKFATHPTTNNDPVLPEAALAPDRILIFEEEISKEEALNKLVDTFVMTSQVSKMVDMRNGIFAREELMSTGIGVGIAVPHVRLDSVRDIVMALGICRVPINDYESIDNVPVRLIFMIAAATNQHAKHLRLLSQISTRLKDEMLREQLAAASEPTDICALLAGK